MPILSFPSSPIIGQTYMSGGKSWEWDGSAWVLIRVELEPGRSAYQIALTLGFVGNEAQWLESLRGLPGPMGDGWEAGTEDNLLWLSVLVQGRVVNQVSTLPGSPTEGMVYLLAADHSTHPNGIAVFYEGAWNYRAPLAGFRFHNVASGRYVKFNGTIWVDDGDFTDVVRSTVVSMLTEGSNITIDHDDVLDTLTINAAASVDEEQVRDVISTMLVQGSNITLDYNDTADTLTINSTGGGGGDSRYRFGGFLNTSPFLGEIVFQHVLPERVWIPNGMPTSIVTVRIPPPVTITFYLKMSGVQIGTMTITSAGVCTINFTNGAAGGATFNRGTLFQIVHNSDPEVGGMYDLAYTFEWTSNQPLDIPFVP